MKKTADLVPLDQSGAGLSSLRQGIDHGGLRASELLEACFDNIARFDDPANQVYTSVFHRTARAEAEAIDLLHKGGVPLGDLAGLPIALKVLFDVKGEVTHSGSKWWTERAHEDALIVSRLRRAGAVITGHTNMTEFAYSGVGLNPHYGTPANPLAPGRLSGGSSSGAASAVASGMAAAAIGTDTGGSVRIPAAFCGLVGFKPTQQRIPREGLFALSDSLDSIGPIARSVDCCDRIDAVLSGEHRLLHRPADLRGRRFAVPRNYMMDEVSPEIADAFDRSLRRLQEAGAQVAEVSVPVLDTLPELMEGGGFTAAESYHMHREWLQQHGDDYDPRVRVRIERGASLRAADYLELLRCRAVRKKQADEWLADFDGLLAPTVPIVPPKLHELDADDDYARLNLLILRNPTVANLLDLCAITLPNHSPGELPSGLTLMGRVGADSAVLGTARAMEQVLNR
ncbi:MAG: amidase [Marinobacter sp.]|uniref:amidase n=1 Tax=Marinobacter sp. TaxID=50741 RepID=UPI003F9A3E51